MVAPVTYVKDFMDPEDADMLFFQLWKHLPWERRDDAPRREYWMNSLGRSYTYGKGRGERTYEPHKMTPEVFNVMAHAIRASCIDGFPYSRLPMFEACFLNGYEGERDHLGWHCDDDPNIDHSKPILVVTLYGTSDGTTSRDNRILQVKQIPKPGITEPIHSQELHHGSMLIMHPGMQSTHYHRIPKASFKSRPRISLTFRAMIHEER